MLDAVANARFIMTGLDGVRHVLERVYDFYDPVKSSTFLGRCRQWAVFYDGCHDT